MPLWYDAVMSGEKLSAILPALDAARTIDATLAALEEGRCNGIVREVLVVDGGSRDETAALAARRGARVLNAPRGRGAQLAAGAAAAQGDWLLFLHADTRLAAGWSALVAAYLGEPANAKRAGAFRFALDDTDPAARRIERLARWRAAALGLPYGDQGLLIASAFYCELGGFRPLPLMEDVDLVRRIGRGRIDILAQDAVTSAARYRSGGWRRRPLANLVLLALYYLGVPPRVLVRLYG